MKLLFALTITGSLALPLQAQLSNKVYRLDPTFQRPRLTIAAYPIRVIADGRGGLLWTWNNGGTLEYVNGQLSGGLIRTMVNGIPDPEFRIGPRLTQTLATVVQPDGRILVGGALAGDLHNHGIPNYRIFRFNTNGSLDFSYRSPVLECMPRFLLLQPDGRLLVDPGPDVVTGNGGLLGMVRLNPDGTLDRSFTTPMFSGYSFAPAVLDFNGRILVAGNFTAINGVARQGVARLLSDGQLDYSFNPPPSGYASTIRGIVVQPDGKIVVGGRMYLGSSNVRYAMIRLNSDGTLDQSFQLMTLTAAGFTTGYIRNLRGLPGGQMLALGCTVARFNADGTLDTDYQRPSLTFDSDGTFECYWMDALPDGSVVVPSTVAVSVNLVPVGNSFRLTPTGTLDTTYVSPSFQGEAHAGLDFALQPDGQPVVWGRFDHCDSFATPGVVRLNSDGQPDTSYGGGLPEASRAVEAGVMAEDGRLYALMRCGSPDILTGLASNQLVRLDSNGQADPAFQPHAVVPPLDAFEPPFQLTLQTNRLVVWRNAAQEVLNGKPFMVRLNEEGSQDLSFTGLANPIGRANRLGEYLDSVVVGGLKVLCAASNGTMLASLTVGDYADPATPYTHQLFKLHADGTLANDFTGPSAPGAVARISFPMVYDPVMGSHEFPTCYAPNPGADPFQDAVLFDDGSALVAGQFYELSGVPVAGLARLNADGSVDSTFNTAGQGAMNLEDLWLLGKVDRITQSKEGKTWVVGRFDTFNYQSCSGVAGLNPDGSLDECFTTQINLYPYTEDYLGLALDPQGDLWLSGPFRAPKDQWPFALTKLTLHPKPILPKPAIEDGQVSLVMENPQPGNPLIIEASNDLVNWTPIWTNSTQVISLSESIQLGENRYYRGVSVVE